jgi:flavodoxin
MKAVVVYESLYGNTHAIAEAVAEGLREEVEVEVAAVGDSSAELISGADLLVVGGPTHVHGMSSKLSLKGAVDDAVKKGRQAPDVHGPPLKDWFDTIGTAGGRRAAAFDTRIDKPRIITGSAAKGIAHRLRGHGYDVVGEASFLVGDMAGPLGDGELERAKEWGRTLVAS